MSDYAAFLAAKAQLGSFDGFEPIQLPGQLFDFQRALVEWALRKGRSAIFADCGLGKTPMQLAWADNVVRRTNKPVLILTPIAVSPQTVVEAEKFGIECRRSPDGKVHPGINVTNYERLHYFNPDDFAGVVCDESSILKAFDGVTRLAITEFLRTIPYRLLCTATAAPNDYVELGTSSEALGYMKHREMLSRFFIHDGGDTSRWRLKKHAQALPFWRWVCSWARAIRRPSDLGFSDRGFELPPLVETEHVVAAAGPAVGLLFDFPAVGLQEQREERRRTMRERCEKVAELVAHAADASLIWCHLNDEGDLLEELIPDAVQVSGSDSDERKESAFVAFQRGDISRLITKPKIGGWGLNFQRCAHITFFPSHSFEQYYQCVRRCWRFGQHRPVRVDVVTSPGERGVMENLQRKAAQAADMFTNLVAEMTGSLAHDDSLRPARPPMVPAWL